MTAIELIDEERSRQVMEEGWHHGHDDEHTHGELARAAACYCLPEHMVDLMHIDGVSDAGLAWPWEGHEYKPTEPGDPIRQLVKAGALIVAEIERLQRASKK